MDTIETLKPSKFRMLVLFNVAMLVGWTLLAPVILIAVPALIGLLMYDWADIPFNLYDWGVMKIWLKVGAVSAVIFSCAILITRTRGIDITDYGMKADYRSENGFFSFFLMKRYLVPKGQNVPHDPDFQSYPAAWFGNRIVMGADEKGFCFNEFHFNKDQRAIVKAKLKEFYNLDLLTRSP